MASARHCTLCRPGCNAYARATNANPYAYTYTYSSANPFSHTGSNTETNSYAHTYGYSNAYPGTDTHACPDAHAEHTDIVGFSDRRGRG